MSERERGINRGGSADDRTVSLSMSVVHPQKGQINPFPFAVSCEDALFSFVSPSSVPSTPLMSC